MHSARQGDQQAFQELVLRYERRIFQVIHRFIADQGTIADLTQDVFLRAWERLGQFDPARRFGPWLFRLAVNLTYDHLRRVRRKGRWSLFSDLSATVVPDPGRLIRETKSIWLMRFGWFWRRYLRPIEWCLYCVIWRVSVLRMWPQLRIAAKRRFAGGWLRLGGCFVKRGSVVSG